MRIIKSTQEKSKRLVWNEVGAGENEFLNKFMSNGQKIFFDVGARYESHIVSKLYSEDKHFHLFEPNPKFYLPLGEKYSAYKNVNVNNVALGSSRGQMEYFEKSQSFFNRKVLHQSTPGEILNVTTLDEYCVSNDVREIDFLKIDTEGFELNVIRGSKEMLQKIKCIQFEYGGTYIDAGISLSGIIDELRLLSPQLKWELYMLQPGALIHIDKTDIELFETFNYANFILSKETFNDNQI